MFLLAKQEKLRVFFSITSMMTPIRYLVIRARQFVMRARSTCNTATVCENTITGDDKNDATDINYTLFFNYDQI